jgi:hypothetical protein
MTPENRIKILEEENRKMRAMLWSYTTADGMCTHCGKGLCCLTSGFTYCHWCGRKLS